MSAGKPKGSKRSDIVAAADRVFYHEGFAHVGIDRIAEEAGVALGTLYRHFRSRTDLVIAALEYRERTFFEALDRAVESLQGEARVLALFDGLEDWALRKGGNGCLFLRAAADHPDDAGIRAVAFAHKRAYLDLVRRRLLEGGWRGEQVERLAPALFLLLEGAVATAGVLGDEGAKAIARKAAQSQLRADKPRR